MKRSEKIYWLCDALQQAIELGHERLPRPTLIKLVMKVLKSQSLITVYSWIKTLESEGFIKENPHHDRANRATSRTIYIVNKNKILYAIYTHDFEEEKLRKTQLGLSTFS